MKSLKNKNMIFTIFLLFSCSQYAEVREKKSYDYDQKRIIKCTKNSAGKEYKVGDLPCLEEIIKVSKNETLKIHFKIANKDSDDPYNYGHHELLRNKSGRVVEKLKLRLDEDANWSMTPFVRIRQGEYLADLDNDGFLEFAIFPFSPGSAIWGTVRIYSLKDKIEFWGEGRYQFEGDTFVQLGCLKCSKFNPEACKVCR